MKKLIALLLLLPVLASADPGENPHLKQDSPDELQYYVGISTDAACPIKIEAVEEVVKGVFVRSRIKPVRNDPTDSSDRELFLFVSLACYDPPESDHTIYSLEVGFGQRVEMGEWNFPVRFFLAGEGTIGVGNFASIRSSVKEIVEDEIAEYLRANFDLGDDE